MRKYKYLVATLVSMVMLMILLMFVYLFRGSLLTIIILIPAIIVTVLYDDKLIK